MTGDRRRRGGLDSTLVVVALLVVAASGLVTPTTATTTTTMTSADGCGSAAGAACECVGAFGGGGGGTEMSCLRAGITSLPPVPPDTVRLDVRRNSIPTLANGSLASLTSLAFVDLSWNGIVTVQPAAFAGLTALTELRLNNNLLTRLYDYTFKDLAQLQTLLLSGNNLVALSGATFYGLLNLVALDLSSNQLSALPANALVPLASLQTLSLAGNVLVGLPDSLLVMQASLVSFSAAGNLIASLPQTAFFAASRGIASVDVSLNRLTSVPSGFFAGATALSSVQLGGAAIACDCTAYALRAWMNSASVAQARSAWLAAPATSGTCAQPPALQGTYVINVPTSSFVCTTVAASTTATSPATTAAANATTTTTIAAGGGGGTAGAGPGGASQSSTASGGASTAEAAAGRLSDTAAIILGSCIGVLALMVAVTLTLVLRRRCPANATGQAAAKGAKRARPLQATPTPPQPRIDGGGGGNGGAPGRAAGNTFSPPTKHVRLMAPAANGAAPRDAEPPTAAANGSALAKLYGPSPPPPKMNGLVPYAHARRSRADSADQPDGAPTNGHADAWPNGEDAASAAIARPLAPAYYVDPGTPHAADFAQRHAPVYLSARSFGEGRWLEPVRNAPSTSSLRASKPAHLLPPGGGASAAAAAAGRSPSYGGGGWHRPTLLAPGQLAIVAPDGHPQVTVLPSQGSVDSGVHSLTPYTDAGTPSTHRSFSPLSNDAIFVNDAPSKPPLLEPRRYKNDTFV